MSQTFDFQVPEYDGVTVKVPFVKPAGTVVAKFYTSQTTKSKGVELANVVTWDATNLIITINGIDATADKFPARYTVGLTINGQPEIVALTGRIGFTPYAPEAGEVEVKNEIGTNLKVLVANTGTSVGGTVTTVGNKSAFYVANLYPSVTFYLFGTFTGANLIFEQSPDSTNGTDGNWFPVLASKLDSNIAATTTGVIAAATAYKASVTGAAWVRARLTAITTGSVTTLITGSPYESEPVPAIGTHAVSQSGVWSTTPIKATTAGLTRHRLLTAAGTNATVVKSTAGQVYTVHAYNNTAAVKFLKFYNKATAPTVGTDVPVETYPLPPNAWTRISFEDLGNAFATGIGIAVTGAIADTDTTAVAVNDVVVNTHYA